MKPDSILEDVWQIKDQLAREAGYDIRAFCVQLKEWSKAHPHLGPVFNNADELHHYLEQREAAALREEPPELGKNRKP
jgi:hypothetical protein